MATPKKWQQRAQALLLPCTMTVLLASCGESPQPPVDNSASPRMAAAMPVQHAGDANCLALSGDSARNYHREVRIEGGAFTMGSDQRYREELPAHEAEVGGFWMDTHEVTNRQFARFVAQTGYVTTAERAPLAADYPDVPADKLVAGSGVFIPPTDGKSGHWRTWWRYIPGANWQHPQGPESNIDGLENHPVVQVSYLDAKAYAEWLGRELPTEAQWERAAQSGALLNSMDKINSVEMSPSADMSISANNSAAGSTVTTGNTWQGFFPLQNKALDGFTGTAPVGCYTPNQLGLFDMIGNVWEITQDPYRVDHKPGSQVINEGAGPLSRVIKGGSYLCANSYCRRDQPQARQPQEEDFGTDHLGFRTVDNRL